MASYPPLADRIRSISDQSLARGEDLFTEFGSRSGGPIPREAFRNDFRAAFNRALADPTASVVEASSLAAYMARSNPARYRDILEHEGEDRAGFVLNVGWELDAEMLRGRLGERQYEAGHGVWVYQISDRRERARDEYAERAM